MPRTIDSARGGDQGTQALGRSLRRRPHGSDALNNSIGVDFRCGHMTSVSQGWAVALWVAHRLNARREQDARARSMRLRSPRGRRGQPTASMRTCNLIDRLLHEEGVDVASKLHTGRSRNDQVRDRHTLWTMDSASSLDHAVPRA